MSQKYLIAAVLAALPLGAAAQNAYVRWWTP
jgi:hypothetical protein